MKKHSKILDSDYIDLINAMLKDGMSSREISEKLKNFGFEISHTAISNYANDYCQEKDEQCEQEKHGGIDMNKIYVKAMTMTWADRTKLADNINAVALLMIEEKLKNGTLVTKDIEQAKKLVDLAKNSKD